jgi:DNA-binding XRE family transcriptional regulator
MIRPLKHMTDSHSEKINEWVSQLKKLGYKPIIKILEVCTENNLDEKEIAWIKKSKEDGCYLLNLTHNHVDNIITQKEYNFEYSDIIVIGKTIKETRQTLNLRQEDLCSMAKISRPTLIGIENGNKKIIYDNLKRVLNVLGYELTIKSINNEKTTSIIT